MLRRADGYYCQFLIKIELKENLGLTEQMLGIDVGFNEFYTDSNGHKEPNPKFFRQGEKQLKRYQRRLSRKQKGSNNRRQARQRLAKKHLRISRQRTEHAKQLARRVMRSNGLVAYEDLQVRNLVKNQNLAKSISDVGWRQFRTWLEYFGCKFGKITVAVPPQYTSQNCSGCGRRVEKSLSTRTHQCRCGTVLDRDENAAINILEQGLATVGHIGSYAWGDATSTQVGEVLSEQVESQNQESKAL